METTREEFSTEDKAYNEQQRNLWVDTKVKNKDQDLAVIVQDCDRILKYFNRIGSTKPGDKILDVGCGTGRITIELANRGYDAYGTDINPDFIKVALDKAPKDRSSNPHFATAPAEELPFDDNTFNICILLGVLEHVDDWKKTINEVARTLKPGGIAYFTTTSALHPLNQEVKYVPLLGYIPYKLRHRIINYIKVKHPKLVGYSLRPAQYWFTHTGLRKALFKAGFNRSWDLFDLINKQEIPSRFRFARWLLPLIRKLPYPYIRDIAHFPLPSVTLVCQKG